MTTIAAPARFIVFEGIEGTGKSTQIRRLSDTLELTGIFNICTREPGGSPGAEEIRQMLVTGDGDRWATDTEALLFAAARAEHLARTIKPNLRQGNWVLCDRFCDSTMALQGHGRGIDLQRIQDLQDWTLRDFFPDLVIILDLPAEEGLRRANARRGIETRFEDLGLGFHEKVRRGFLSIAKDHPQTHKVVDASGSVEEVTARVWQVVCDQFFPDGMDFVTRPIAGWFSPSDNDLAARWVCEPYESSPNPRLHYREGFHAAVAWLQDASIPRHKLPRGNDGEEQKAFVAWATAADYDMTEHPLHFLFVNPATADARMGWRAALTELATRWEQKCLQERQG